MMPVADPEIMNGGGGEDYLSVLSSFIANAHNEIHAFYRGKRRLSEKNRGQYGGANTAPLNSPLNDAAISVIEFNFI